MNPKLREASLVEVEFDKSTWLVRGGTTNGSAGRQQPTVEQRPEVLGLRGTELI